MQSVQFPNVYVRLQAAELGSADVCHAQHEEASLCAGSAAALDLRLVDSEDATTGIPVDLQVRAFQTQALTCWRFRTPVMFAKQDSISPIAECNADRCRCVCLCLPKCLSVRCNAIKP